VTLVRRETARILEFQPYRHKQRLRHISELHLELDARLPLVTGESLFHLEEPSVVAGQQLAYFGVMLTVERLRLKRECNSKSISSFLIYSSR
jgi:hypothetical protein